LEEGNFARPAAIGFQDLHRSAVELQLAADAAFLQGGDVMNAGIDR
jgi:hypothetical protein